MGSIPTAAIHFNQEKLPEVVRAVTKLMEGDKRDSQRQQQAQISIVFGD